MEMRIAIFTDTYTPEINGVAKTLQRLTMYLEENRIPFKVFAPESKTSVPVVPQIERFASLPLLFYPECRIALPNPVQMKQTLEQFNPTFIHIATPLNLGLYGLLYGKKHRIPMVASYHTHFDDYLQYYHIPFLQKWLWKYMVWFHRSFERVYVPSQSTMEKLKQHTFHHDLEIWGRGIDHLYYTPQNKTDEIKKKYQITQPKILLYVGRIAPEKEIDIALQTYHSLPVHIKEETHFLIVGDGPQFKLLSEISNDHITFTGFLEGEELANIYASSDLFLFPSSTETFGNVVLEAMASGLPVVGANAGGVQHLIHHGETGFLCEPRNVRDFANYTSMLLEDGNLRGHFSQEARQIALTRSWDKIFSNLFDSYREIFKRKSHLYSA
ncbi:glycosyltransferase family 1 protein [Alkalihalobacillus sp. MEB130]|uniref:glycosyltransferase family 4 protein n=1 Tax=Alkalihalobacillus sp. MEB130 TaxID=2976704 RepID=UPI0028DE9168|nr:glycosyltransferase family 1 protein [Alkalihalobacillus sp. MEB130]MDT8859311.1 glycosyltransferase family 1 protein [Alkalihalobacillus sp. MEB130]